MRSDGRWEPHQQRPQVWRALAPDHGHGRRDARTMDVTVHNHGPVIPPEKRETLFRAFQRLTEAEMSGKSGWGLGLAQFEQSPKRMAAASAWTVCPIAARRSSSISRSTHVLTRIARLPRRIDAPVNGLPRSGLPTGRPAAVLATNVDERVAPYVAQAFKQDTLKAGWISLTPPDITQLLGRCEARGRT